MKPRWKRYIIQYNRKPNNTKSSTCSSGEERRDCNPTWLRFKTYLRHSFVSLGKTLYGIFPCLAVLASSFKF